MEGAADSPREKLARGDVDVWGSDPAALADPALCAACEALLTDEERTRQRAFVFEKNRRATPANDTSVTVPNAPASGGSGGGLN